MKKFFILSITLNIAIVSFLIGKRYYYSHQSVLQIPDYTGVRKSIFSNLTIDTSDIVFVGNSLTEAFMVSEFFGPRCKNRGINGNKLSDILNRINLIAQRRPMKIFLEGGINDISNGQSPDYIANNYTVLIETIKKISPHTTLYIQSVLPTGKEYNQKEKVIAVNELLKSICKDCGITFIDLYSSFERSGYIIDSLTYDGVHLTGAGYTKWVDKIRPYIK